MNLDYDEQDDASPEARGSKILFWLDDLGAEPLSEARPGDPGFLFAGARPLDDYARLVAPYPHLRDRPEERAPLLRLDTVLDALAAEGVDVPTPRTWRLALDAPVPADLTFPLFVRTAYTSLKLGGRISRVRDRGNGNEAAELRRARVGRSVAGPRLARSRGAGRGMYARFPRKSGVGRGRPAVCLVLPPPAPVPIPTGFPPDPADLGVLYELSGRVGSAFRSRCVAADFAREAGGGWLFIEAGPGAARHRPRRSVQGGGDSTRR